MDAIYLWARQDSGYAWQIGHGWGVEALGAGGELLWSYAWPHSVDDLLSGPGSYQQHPATYLRPGLGALPAPSLELREDSAACELGNRVLSGPLLAGWCLRQLPPAGHVALGGPPPAQPLTAPPALPAGATPYNETFFCGSNGRCYSWTADKLDWPQARQDCQARGGDLVAYDSYAEQAMVGPALRG